MRPFRRGIHLVAISGILLGILGGETCPGAKTLRIVEQYPSLARFKVVTQGLTVRLRFSDSLDRTSSIAVTRQGEEIPLPGRISFTSVRRPDDTILLAVESPLELGATYELHAEGVRALDGTPFDGTFPEGERFVPNVPIDLNDDRQEGEGPALIGYNPTDPEGTDPDRPLEIPGASVTEAWKYTTGRPDVVIAVIDDGFSDFSDDDLRTEFFLNRGELPPPACEVPGNDPWDCNGDGRFNVEDYAADDRVADRRGDGIDIGDLIAAFADGADDDDNGYPDDISGFDFFRRTPEGLGVDAIPEGVHGDLGGEGAAGVADNPGSHDLGACPRCTILPLRIAPSLLVDSTLLAEAVRYATDMGAAVLNLGIATLNNDHAALEALEAAHDRGIVAIAALGDELSYEHEFPGAYPPVIPVKAIYDLAGAFVESGCTSYGSHLLLSVPSHYCTSSSVALASGVAGLVVSRARDLGITLSAGEVKQLLTMTADDIAYDCVTLSGGDCSPGWDEHFGYGRLHAGRALLALGDPQKGIPPRIPPDVEISAPAWFSIFNPRETPTIEVSGRISARAHPFHYEIDVAAGLEPAERAFTTQIAGEGMAPIDGFLGEVDIRDLIAESQLERASDDREDFAVTLRIRAWYTDDHGVRVVGEDRRALSLRIDDDPGSGLVPGFPIEIGHSGESPVILADLDGDGGEEILFATAGGTIEVFTRAGTERWEPFSGFPVSLRTRHPRESVIASLALGDLLGTGEQVIVAATLSGRVYAIHGRGNLDPSGSPFLPGFPVSADPVDNGSAETFLFGNAFFAAPVLGDLNGDGRLEIVAPSLDGRLYAWEGVDRDGDGEADRLPGWPVLVRSDSRVGDLACRGNGGGEHSVFGLLSVSPVVAILPGAADPEVAAFPAVFLSSTELCDDDGVDGLEAGRFYGIYHDGNLHPGGPFIPGFPVATPMIAEFADAFPLPPVSIGGTTPPGLYWSGEEAVLGAGNFFGPPLLVRYRPGTPGNVSVEVLLRGTGDLNVAAGGTFAPLVRNGPVKYIYPTAGLVSYNDGLAAFSHDIVAWDALSPENPELFDRVEALAFLTNPVVADIDDDDRFEILQGSGGYFLHAFRGRRQDAEGWPKLTNNWLMGAPAAGDIDADGLLEIVTTTREGFLYAWNTTAPLCRGGNRNAPWPRFRHDAHNSGTYGHDAIPPGRIVDLSGVLRSPAGEGSPVGEEGCAASPLTLSLHWTPPGDDGPCGEAARYEIACTPEAGADLTDPSRFAAAPFRISFSIAPRGRVEKGVTLPSGMRVCALRALDSAGNRGLPSNLLHLPARETACPEVSP